jgi:hypothetical protein
MTVPVAPRHWHTTASKPEVYIRRIFGGERITGALEAVKSVAAVQVGFSIELPAINFAEVVERSRNALLATRWEAPGIGLTSVPIDTVTFEYNLEYRSPKGTEDMNAWVDAVLQVKEGKRMDLESLYQAMDLARPVRLGNGGVMIACYIGQDVKDGVYHFWFTLSHAISDGRGLLLVSARFAQKRHADAASSATCS